MNNKVRFFHKHTGNRGGFTIAYMVHDNGNIEWNYARCNEVDNFSRKVGRSIAEGRFWCNKVRNFWVTTTPPIFLSNLATMSDKELTKQFPQSYFYF